MKTISVIVFLKLFIILSNNYQQMWITFRILWIKVYNLFTFQPPYHYYLCNYNNNLQATHNNKQLYTICAQLNTIPIQLHIIHYNMHTSSSNILQFHNDYSYCTILSYFIPLLSYITIIIIIILYTIITILYIIIYYYNNITYNNNTIT